MTQLCFIGAKNQHSLRTFHSQLVSFFNHKEASKIEKEIDFIFQLVIEKSTWVCSITEANLISYNRKNKFEYLNMSRVSFLNKCRQQGRVCIGIVQVAHRESEDEAIARLASQALPKKMDNILKGTPIEANNFYCEV